MVDEKVGVFTVRIGHTNLKDIYKRGVYKISVFNFVIHATGLNFEYYPDPSQDVMVIKVPMRYVTVINEIGEESDAIKN